MRGQNARLLRKLISRDDLDSEYSFKVRTKILVDCERKQYLESKKRFNKLSKKDK